MKLNKTAIFFIVFILVVLAATTFLSMFIGPILLGFLIAYLLNPLFIYLESKGISRNTSSAISIILIILLAATVVWIVLPILISQIQIIVADLPQFNTFLQEEFVPQAQIFLSEMGLKKWSHFNLNSLNVEQISTVLLTGIGESTKFIVSSLFFLVAAPVFIYVFMRRLPNLYAFIYKYVPEKSKPVFVDYFNELDIKTRAVINGQLAVVLIQAILYSIAFSIAGLPTAIGVGVILGIARIISGLDTVLAFTLVPIVLIVNQSGIWIAVYTCIAYLCVQALDNFFVTPKVMGKSSGLHPLVVLIAILVFAYWFGFYGALFAIPIVTILKVSIKRLLTAYTQTSFFKQ